MKNERILNILSQVDEKYILEAAPVEKVKKKNNWIKWGAVAACLAIVTVTTAIYGHLNNGNNEKNQTSILVVNELRSEPAEYEEYITNPYGGYYEWKHIEKTKERRDFIKKRIPSTWDIVDSYYYNDLIIT